MRGAVSAGMVAALKYIGLENTFDVVYGSSAGAIVGAYFVSRQVPMFGAQIYYDTLCSIPENGQRFIDLWALRHHPYLRLRTRNKSKFYGDGARPVLLLDRLLDTVMREQRPLDWKTFLKNHAVQPLKPVASSLTEMRSHIFDSFSDMDEFLHCLRASARVPGIAGNPVEINGALYADCLLFEPIPYRSAVAENCTDVLVLRSKPDKPRKKPVKPGIYEKHIARPYFDMFPTFAPLAEASEYLMSGRHIDVYNDDVARLLKENEVARSYSESAIFSISPPKHAPEVGQLESRARPVYEGVRSGFAAAYDALSPFADAYIDNPSLERLAKGVSKVHPEYMTAGMKAAKWVFPDSELTETELRHRTARKRSVELRKEKRRYHKTVTKRRRVIRNMRSPRRKGARTSETFGTSGDSFPTEESYRLGET